MNTYKKYFAFFLLFLAVTHSHLVNSHTIKDILLKEIHFLISSWLLKMPKKTVQLYS
jgi:hypothetical protein